jgi:dolichol-phosphate mannosyltransferase
MSKHIELEIVLPAHNERLSIEGTLKEIHSAITSKLPSHIIVCEDGSSDGTPELVRELASELPVSLRSSSERKGYSRAVKEGLFGTEAPWVLCLDSDGQCDPRDFWKFWERRFDGLVMVGWRNPRCDPWVRLFLSRVFFLVFRVFFPVPLHDPSCPMVMMKREALRELVPHMGRMDQGFWWEFSARCKRAGITPIEIPIHHRERSAGATQIYKFRKMPGIFGRHFVALLALRFLSQPKPGQGKPLEHVSSSARSSESSRATD